MHLFIDWAKETEEALSKIERLATRQLAEDNRGASESDEYSEQQLLGLEDSPAPSPRRSDGSAEGGLRCAPGAKEKEKRTCSPPWIYPACKDECNWDKHFDARRREIQSDIREMSLEEGFRACGEYMETHASPACRREMMEKYSGILKDFRQQKVVIDGLRSQQEKLAQEFARLKRHVSGLRAREEAKKP
ncbi:MAG: hypothetical protein GY696_19695, partial [Gammaproteobacteria bacterium]|nr:hypothetical protein [Gammaproteobacteria bacterium]